MSADAVTHLSQGATMLLPQSVEEDDGQCGPSVLESGTPAPVLPCFAQVESTKAQDPMEKTTFPKVSCLTSNTTDFTLFSETEYHCVALVGPDLTLQPRLTYIQSPTSSSHVPELEASTTYLAEDPIKVSIGANTLNSVASVRGGLFTVGHLMSAIFP